MLVTTLLWVAHFSACSFLSSSTQTAIADVSVVDVRNAAIKPHMSVVIAGDRIVAVGPISEIQIPAQAVVMDGKGKFLIPGLWDMHVHAGANPRVLRLLLAAGITGVRDMGGDLTKLLETRRQVRSGRLSGPMIFLAGPMLEGPPSEANDDTWIVRTPDDARRAVTSLVDRGVDFIKVHDHLTRDAYMAVASSAKARGVPFAGHVSEFISPREASDIGQKSIEHFEFLPKPCMALFNLNANSTPPGCDQTSLNSLLQRLAQNRTWLVPTIGSFRYFAPKQWTIIMSTFRELTALIRDDRVQILAGTDQSDYLESKGAVPGQSLHEEMGLLVDAGFTPAEALRAATSNAADYLGLAPSVGAIDKGKSADLVLLYGDPLKDINNTKRIAAVIREGRVYNQTALEDLRSAKP